MSLHILYGARYILLCVIDMLCFRWHGYRPLAWQKQLVHHAFTAPQGGSLVPFGTDKERQELTAAQALFPDRYMYLGVGMSYSPLEGERWLHYVKVLVKDATGAPPTNRYGGGSCYGMPFERFLETPWAKQHAQ